MWEQLQNVPWFLGFLLCARQDARDGVVSLSCLALLMLLAISGGPEISVLFRDIRGIARFIPTVVFGVLVRRELAGTADLFVVAALSLRYSLSCTSAIIAIAACSALLSSAIVVSEGPLPFIPHLFVGDALAASWCWDCFLP